MDSNDRRSRQTNPSGYAGQQGLIQGSSQYPAVTAAGDRFRHPQIPVQSPTSAPSTARAGGLPGYSYPYGEGSHFAGSSMQASPLQYQAEYSQEAQRAPQSYQYGQNLAGMYNVPAQQQQPTQQTAYEAVQSYQPPRQSAAIEVLSNQFGVPQQYYVPGEGPTSAPNTGLTGQQAQYNPLSYGPQGTVGRENIASTYPGGLSEGGQAQGGYTQTTYPAQTAAQAAELDVAYGQYLQELRRTFESVRDGRIGDAGPSLLHISEWLLGNAEALGLVRDDESMHAERLKLWEDFNYCWLVTLQRQKEMTIDLLDAGQQRPHQPQSILDTDYLESMGKELIRLCDIMEKHGLVDYQLGVWEEEIIYLLTDCLDLLDKNVVPPGSSGNPQAGSSSTQRRR